MTQPQSIRCQITIRFDDEIMRDHRVHGVRLMPGVTFLDMVYRIMHAKNFPVGELVLREILFMEAVSTSEDYDSRIHFTFEPQGDGWRVVARSQKIKGDQVVRPEWSENLRCEIRRAAPKPPATIDPRAFQRRARRTVDMEEVYAFARGVDIVHGPFMKGLGQVFVGEDSLMAAFHLGDAARAYLDHFYLHPAYLDASTLTPFLFYQGVESDPKPYIPMYIDAFQAGAALGESCYVTVTKPRAGGASGDVSYADIAFHDANGERVAILTKLTAKRIRHSGLITRLTGQEATARRQPRPQSPVPEPAPAATDQQIGAFETQLQRMVADLKQVAPARVSLTQGFYDQGLESTDLLQLVQRLENDLGRKLYPTLLFEYNNIADLAAYLAEEADASVFTADTDVSPPPPESPVTTADSAASAGAAGFETRLRRMIATQMNVPETKVDVDQGFYDQGLESTDLLKLVQDLETWLDRKLYPTLLFEYNNIRDLAAYLAETAGEAPLSAEKPAVQSAEPSRELLYFKQVWREQPIETGPWPAQAVVLVFDEDEGLFQALGQATTGQEIRRVLIRPGQGFAETGGSFTINPQSSDDHERLVTTLQERGLAPSHIVHAWSRAPFQTTVPVLTDQYHRALHAVAFLTRALMKHKLRHDIRLLFVYHTAPEQPQPLFAALRGLFQTAPLENPKCAFRTVALHDTPLSPDQTASILLREWTDPGDHTEIRYEGARRLVRMPAPVQPPEQPAFPFPRKNGVYLITGGAGGLGLQWAEYLCRQGPVTLVLTGRSELPREKQNRLQAMRDLGASVHYLRTDIASREAVTELVTEIKSRFGALHGVFHAAGVLRDAFLIAKTARAMDEVLAPKVFGTVWLDEATRAAALDCFVMFSSISAVFGNPGQADYAYANRFMDAYAEWREDLRERGQHAGKTVSVNWPLWRDSGMPVDAGTLAGLESLGIAPLETQAGFEALQRCLGGDDSTVLVLQGDAARINQTLGLTVEPALPPTPPIPQEVRDQPAEKKPAVLAPAARWVRGHRDHEAVAVIGMAGRYPQAPDLEAFWHNLASGKDCITEIPPDRWDYRPYFDPRRGAKGKTYSKWGGFIEDVDKFDALFFNVPPRVAEELDPQERLFLETVWHTLEDACYTRRALAGTRTGVFVGVMWSQYPLFGAEETLKGHPLNPSGIFASIANHVSYFFDWRGPSLALDTMCSSSLTAIHLACESILRGETELAVAGGVNVTIHPSKYSFLSQSMMPSSDGRCRSFGAGGDGYVPGEGVGALLLKPLSQAEADGDRIHGVILTSVLNHGGKTSGYTVPSPRAQAELIAEALDKAGVDPRTIGYIEAHGTGTSLGDPIEISGLNKAFQPYGLNRQSCAVGSVKSNVGHLESAAGIAGITKLLLQFRHRQLAPSLHAEELNPQIDFENSAFFVQRQLADWPAPEISVNGQKRVFPRRAGISGFGAGGANAHIVLEEHPSPATPVRKAGPYLFVFSARDEDRLQNQVRAFLAHMDGGNGSSAPSTAPDLETTRRHLQAMAAEVIKVEPDQVDVGEDLNECGFDPVSFTALAQALSDAFETDVDPSLFATYPTLEALAAHFHQAPAAAPKPASHRPAHHPADVAFTLQVGREAMESRLAVLSESLAELSEKLQRFLRGDRDVEACFHAHLEQGPSHPLLLSRDAEDIEYLRAIVTKGRLEKIARFWVEGADIDWRSLYPHGQPRPVSLPHYPFARERYWLPIREGAPAMASGLPAAALHPLLDANVSTLREQCFSKILRPNDVLLEDHRVQGQKMLPGTAYLEMVRAAAEIAGERPVTTLFDVIWARPLVVADDPREVRIALRPRGSAVAFEVSSTEEGQKIIHSQGTVGFGQTTPAPVADLDAVRKRCPLVKDQEEMYRLFTAMGFQYGPSFRVTERVHAGNGEALVKLQNPPAADESGPYGLHPSLMDGALRAITALGLGATQGTPELHIPFALGKLEILKPLTPVCYALARPAGEQTGGGTLKFDIALHDERGQVLVRIRDFTARPVQVEAAVPVERVPESAPAVDPPAEPILCFRPVWRETAAGETSPDEPRPLLIFDTNKTLFDVFKQRHSDAVILAKPGKAFKKLAPDRFLLDPAKREDYHQLFKHLGNAPRDIVFAWTRNQPPDLPDDAKIHHALATAFEHGLYPVLHLFQAVNALADETKTRCLYLTPERDGGPLPQHEPVAGLAKALVAVNHRFELVSLRAAVKDQDPAELAGLIETELHLPQRSGTEVRYRAGQRVTRVLELFDPVEKGDPSPLLKQGGVYLITGGFGALGLLFTRHLTARYRARLVLSGRSPASEKHRQMLEQLSQLGGEAFYLPADVADPESVTGLVQAAKQRFGRLDGVLHSAGILGEHTAAEVDRATFDKALAPKIQGTLNLDQATRDEALDCFLLFSSISAEVGDFGTGNYAAANRFMDSFAAYRENLRAAGKRQGRTQAVNWPLWQGGGMEIPEEQAALYFQFSGMRALSAERGLALFETLLGRDEPQIFVAHGDAMKIHRVLGLEAPATAEETPEVAETLAVQVDGDDELFTATVDYLKNIFSQATKIPLQRIKPKVALEKYGIDSIMIMELTGILEKDFESLPKTLFFEYANLHDLAGWFTAQRGDRLHQLLGLESKPRAKAPAQPAPMAAQAPLPAAETGPSERFWEAEAMPRAATGQEVNASDPIAIIGMAGRYPQAPDLDAFWERLREGRNCITEIPAERWNHEPFFDPDRDKEGACYSKWGGFIDEVDRFDPLFFNISPMQAEFMDPQERLILETVWHGLENAGYTRQNLVAGMVTGAGSRAVGVFIGCMYQHYPLFAEDPALRAALSINSYSSLANRVSYFFDFQGPSVAVDTACSASLTAIHLATQSIRRGECAVAFAGGVNLSLHPYKYVGLAQAMMIGGTDRSMSLGQGDGFVPGEGVGVVLLKSLVQARRDRDHIHGVILGSAINHGGKTNGFTVPNPNAQADLIAKAMKNAGVGPADLGYIETAANGSNLGDPIEIAALNKAFQTFPGPGRKIPIGAVKANIGHLEAASGISQLTKVLLQMKHRTLAPSINAEPLNPNLGLEDTPFAVQKEPQAWEPPVGEDGLPQPRRAAISSFGAGGANAHMIVEEAPAPPSQKDESDEACLFVFSARDAERLHDLLARMKDFLTREPDLSARDLAFTLLLGREAMDERLAVIAQNRGELLDKIDAVLAGETVDGTWRDRVDEGSAFEDDPGARERIDVWTQRGDLPKLAQIWVGGMSVDWPALPQIRESRRLPLPGYPFARERYWLPSSEKPRPLAPAGTAPMPISVDKPAATSVEDRVQQLLVKIVAALLKIPESAIHPGKNLQDYGFDSLTGAKMVNRLQDHLGQKIQVRVLFEAATIRELTAVLLREGIATEESLSQDRLPPDAETESAASTQHPSPAEKTRAKMDEDAVRDWLRAMLAELLKMAPEQIDPNKDLQLYGFDSLTGRKLANRIQDHCGKSVPMKLFFEAATLTELAHALVRDGMVPSSSPVEIAAANNEETVRQEIQVLLGGILKLAPELIDPHKDLQDYGFDSLTAKKLANRIQDRYGKTIPVRLFFETATIRGLAEALVREGIAVQPKSVPANGNREAGLKTLLTSLREGGITPRQAARLREKLKQAQSVENKVTAALDGQTASEKNEQLKMILAKVKEGKITPQQAVKLKAQLEKKVHIEVSQ